MTAKQRSLDDVHDIWNVEIGKPYRGQLVEKIDLETKKLDNGKVKVKRLIHLDNGIILIEETWHEYGEVFVDGKLLPYNEIQFPSMDPADFAAPVRPKDDDDDDDEKKKKRELLRQKAKDMMNKKAPDRGPGDDELRIKVKTPDGRMIPVVVKPNDTVDDLYDKITNDHDIPVDKYNLSRNGKPLKNQNATMEDCGVKTGDVIEMTPKPMSITVNTPEGTELPISVKPTDTIRDVKRKVEKEHGISCSDQPLSFKGSPLNDPSATLDDCGIEDGDALDLEPDDDGTFTVNVRTPDGKKLPVEIKHTDTVQDLKETIETDHGIPVGDQNLSLRRRPLDDPDATMKDYGVRHGDNIDLKPDSDGGSDNATNRNKSPNLFTSGDDSYPPGKDRKRILNPDSAWVYPTKGSAPRKGEPNNLQGIWSTPPQGENAGTEPVEVNIHPKHKEPKSDGKADIHGAYGYINGAKPDEDGVVDPSNVVFYPPGQKQKDFAPDFEHVGWWSAPESSSKTTVSWKFVGDDIYNVKKHTVNVMGHEMTFVTEWME